MNPLTEEHVRQIIREELASLIATDRYTFQKHLQIFDGRHIQLGLTNGTKVGTSASQKVAFYGATPIVQANSISAPSSPGVLYAQADAASAVAAINSLRTAVKNFGITS